MTRLLKALLIVALIYAAIAVAMYTKQRSFIYIRDPLRVSPAAAGVAGASERLIKTADGETLVSWSAPAKAGQPTLLYFHGNAGNLEARSVRMRRFLSHGRGILMVAYRGYSGSTGMPTEANLIADAERAYETLIDSGLKPDDIIIYGESLGAAVAVQLAARKPVRGVILDAPFTSLVALASLSYPWLPVGLLLQDRYTSDAYITGVKAPVLVVHGENDEVTPVAMGRAIYARANEPKEIVTVPGAGHSNHGDFGSFDKIDAWIDRIRLPEAK